MSTTPFTTRLDSKLKSRLETIAKYEDRSSSYIANQAIKAFVEEKEQTRELIKTGLDLVNSGVSISSNAVNTWFQEENASFPQPDTFEKI